MTSADWRDGVVCAAVAVLTPARAVATPGLTAPAPLRKSRREIDRSAIQHPLKGNCLIVSARAPSALQNSCPRRGDPIRWTFDLTRAVLRFFLVVSQCEIRVRPTAYLTSRRSPPGESRD